MIACVKLVIVGGGIHGACLAKHAAMQGCEVLLLEKNDFASATSSRSTKLAHGGLRYLELLDFKQVFEGIRARDELFETFPYIVKPQKFLIPVFKKQWFFKYKLSLGLFIYGLLAKRGEYRARWLKADSITIPEYESVRQRLLGAFEYTDGQLSDTRLVLENLTLAKSYGAECKNYCEVTAVKYISVNNSSVTYVDKFKNKKVTEIANFVVNVSGPWVPFLKHADITSQSHPALYSRGVHLLFDKPWNYQALFLPMAGKARYYFVLPHFAGTLVGTTERQIDELTEEDPKPRKDEIEEILLRLEKDLPNAGLNKSTLHYAFAGIRTLPLRHNGADVTQVSRRHIWKHVPGVLSLIGGKYTTASLTALEGLKKVFKILDRSFKPIIKKDVEEHKKRYAVWKNEFEKQGISKRAIFNLTNRYGLRCVDVCKEKKDFEPIGKHCVIGELSYAVKVDQAKNLEDVLRRRLEIEYMPGSALEDIDTIVAYLIKRYPEIDWKTQAISYKERIENLMFLIGKKVS